MKATWFKIISIYIYIYNIAVAQSFFVLRTIQHKKILTTDFKIITFCVSIIKKN